MGEIPTSPEAFRRAVLETLKQDDIPPARIADFLASVKLNARWLKLPAYPNESESANLMAELMSLELANETIVEIASASPELLSEVGPNGKTPFAHALGVQPNKILGALIALNPKVLDVKSESRKADEISDFYPIAYATYYGSVELFNLMLDGRPEQLKNLSSNNTSPQSLVGNTRVAILQKIHSIDPKLLLGTDRDGNNILHYASASGGIDTLHFAIQKVPADYVLCKNQFGRVPIEMSRSVEAMFESIRVNPKLLDMPTVYGITFAAKLLEYVRQSGDVDAAISLMSFRPEYANQISVKRHSWIWHALKPSPTPDKTDPSQNQGAVVTLQKLSQALASGLIDRDVMAQYVHYVRVLDMVPQSSPEYLSTRWSKSELLQLFVACLHTLNHLEY